MSKSSKDLLEFWEDQMKLSHTSSNYFFRKSPSHYHMMLLVMTAYKLKQELSVEELKTKLFKTSRPKSALIINEACEKGFFYLEICVFLSFMVCFYVVLLCFALNKHPEEIYFFWRAFLQPPRKPIGPYRPAIVLPSSDPPPARPSRIKIHKIIATIHKIITKIQKSMTNI